MLTQSVQKYATRSAIGPGPYGRFSAFWLAVITANSGLGLGGGGLGGGGEGGDCGGGGDGGDGGGEGGDGGGDGGGGGDGVGSHA